MKSLVLFSIHLSLLPALPAAPEQIDLPKLASESFSSPVKHANIDVDAYAEWVDGKEKKIVSNGEKSLLPDWVLWTEKSSPNYRPHSFGNTNEPGARHLRINFREEIPVGSVLTMGGGSPISAWRPGQYFDQTKSNPWDDSIAAAKTAMKDGKLKAILWHQGESDAGPKDSPLHEERLTDLITRFRKELDAPDLPFIIGQLGRFPARPWNKDREAIDAAHKAVAAKMKNVAFVPIEDPESVGDNLHFDTATLRRFAQGYADAYLEISGSETR